MKQNLTELMGERNRFTIIVGKFKTTLTIMDKTTRQKTSNKIEDLNNMVSQLDLTGI